jgi:PKD repeat protein
VVDNAGRKSSVETSIEALNRLPHAEFSYEPYQPPIDHPVRFDAALSSDEDGEIVSYEWDFGDGVRATGPVVEHVFPDERILYAVVLTVTDEDGASNATLEYVQAIGCATCG